jgi:glutaryl-CoA dehydrogenase (non-decarboxylating)
MDLSLSKEQQQAQTDFRGFVNRTISPNAEKYDEKEKIPLDLIAELAHQGYLGALLPEEHGGKNTDMLTYGLLNEELGSGSSSVRALVMLQNMIGQAILRWGGKEQASFWLEKIAAGNVIAGFALTEPDVGSDAKQIGTTAALDGNTYILNGQKEWISFGQIADLFLVFAQDEGKLSAFLVERNTPGLKVTSIKGMLGLRATMLAKLEFVDCSMPKDNLIGGVGFGLVPVAIDALNLGRYSVAWGCVGIAKACLEASIQHTQKRKQFGVYLKDHQLIQRMITDMMVNIKAARLLCCKAGLAMAQRHPDSVADTFNAKYFATTMATRAANDAVQIHGAIGCSQESPVQRHLRDAKIMEIIEGTTQIHQIKIAEYAYQAFSEDEGLKI